MVYLAANELAHAALAARTKWSKFFLFSVRLRKLLAPLPAAAPQLFSSPLLRANLRGAARLAAKSVASTTNRQAVLTKRLLGFIISRVATGAASTSPVD